MGNFKDTTILSVLKKNRLSVRKISKRYVFSNKNSFRRVITNIWIKSKLFFKLQTRLKKVLELN